jgi:hypothetical protein
MTGQEKARARRDYSGLGARLRSARCSIIRIALNRLKILARGSPLLGALLLAAAAARSPLEGASPAVNDRDDERLVRETCVSCHSHTPADVLPRTAWRAEIEKMQIIMAAGEEPVPGGPPAPPIRLTRAMARILGWYERHAPEALPLPEPWPAPEAPGRFVRRALTWPDAPVAQPVVANVRLADLDGDPRPEVLVSDMRHGAVLLGRPYDAGSTLRLLVPVPNPVHAEVLDFDQDGLRDIVIGDLGAFYPGDHRRGSVVLLKGLPGGRFAQFGQSGFPRVADVEPGDFDGDGKTDLAVAAFGWRRAGEIALLSNRSPVPSQPAFDRLKLDPRPGTVALAAVDLNRDGRLDLVAAIAQEHEKVVAFFNEGASGFRAQDLFAAPHPNWGLSGMEVVDFDGDSDLDVLLTNGDMFDDWYLKPYHGVQWLENEGRYPFTSRPLARLAGAHRALARDLDGDGDLDVVAGAFTGGTGRVTGAEAELPSLVWLERAGARFTRRTLEVGHPSHATLDVADVDADGDLDIVAGNFVVDRNTGDFVDIWENRAAALRSPAAQEGQP